MLKNILKTKYLGQNLYLNRRTFLSEAFALKDVWNARLTTPILEKVNVDQLYHNLDNKFHQKNKVSAIDVDIYANKIIDDSHTDEIADLLHKFRATEECSNALHSTQHAVIRNYLDHNQIDFLIQILNNRIGYGVFMDDFTASLLLDHLIKANNFKLAARIATILLMEEDFSNEIIKALSLYSCWRCLRTPDFVHFDDLIPPPPPPENTGKKVKIEEVKVRVNYIRNPYFDDHFDLNDSQLLLGKTFLQIGREHSVDLIGSSSKLLGYTLYQKFEEGLKFIATVKEINQDVLGEIKKVLTKIENKDELFGKFSDAVDLLEGKITINKDNFEQKLIDLVNKSVTENEQKQIEQQKQIYANWIDIRKQKLEDELERLHRIKRVQEVERITKDMENEERKLWFFENEDKIDLQIDSKKVYYPKRWFGKKKKPRVIDQDYVPPEVQSRRGKN